MEKRLYLFFSDRKMIEYSLDDNFLKKSQMVVKNIPYSILQVDEEAFIIGEENGII
jgi:hypothetical protein